MTTSLETPDTGIRRRRGRPRDPNLDRRILHAARHVLAERGFTGTSMDEIARTAGVGKDTLYRRWSNKEDLLLQVLRLIAEEGVNAPVDEADPGLALFRFLQEIVRVNVESNFGQIVAGLVGESSRNPDLAAAFHRFWAERRVAAADFVQPIIGADADEVALERALDRVLGPLYYRLLLTGAEISDPDLWELVLSLPWNHEES